MEEKNKKVKNKLDHKKIRIIILIVVALLVIVAVGFLFKRNDDRDVRQEQEQDMIESNKNYEELEDGTQVNISEKMLEDKNIGALIISNTQVTRKNNITTIITDVKNSGQTVDGEFSVNVTFVEEDGDVITSIIGYVPQINPGETSELIISGSYDFVDAYDFKIDKKQ